MSDDPAQLAGELTARLSSMAALEPIVPPPPILPGQVAPSGLPGAYTNIRRTAALFDGIDAVSQPFNELLTAHAHSQQILQAYAQLSVASKTGAAATGETTTAAQTFINAARQLLTMVSGWKVIAIAERWHLTGLEAQAKKQLADTGELLSQQKEAVAKWAHDIEADRHLTKKARADAEAARDAAQKAVAVVGTTKHANLFAAEAKLHRSNATRWLLVVIAVALLTIGTAAGFLIAILRGDLDFDKLSVSSVVVAKVALFVGLYFILVWATRNYRAHRHNAVVNAHRHNALVTFETFVAATDAQDQQVRHAILLRATDCIFAHVPTGYSSGGGEQRSAIEVVEAASKVFGKS